MKLSVVVLSYNDFPGTTGRCLAALAADPDFESWEVIVVDNASDALTRSALRAVQGEMPRLICIFNESNLGFAAGNNVGIARATGDVVVLLNSDTVAPPGMLRRLAAHFKSRPRLGLVGPVSNAAGNEQGIHTVPGALDFVIEQGLRYASCPGDALRSVFRVDFFCVAVARKVIDEVGLLDEGFGRGYYEDFDYSLRVASAGYALAVAEDAFVYHRGSASFAKMPAESRALMRRNKRRVISKHGSGTAFPHARDANLAVLEQYLQAMSRGDAVSTHRCDNRLQHAERQMPKGWLKRWRYRSRLRRLRNAFVATRLA